MSYETRNMRFDWKKSCHTASWAGFIPKLAKAHQVRRQQQQQTVIFSTLISHCTRDNEAAALKGSWTIRLKKKKKIFKNDTRAHSKVDEAKALNEGRPLKIQVSRFFSLAHATNLANKEVKYFMMTTRRCMFNCFFVSFFFSSGLYDFAFKDLGPHLLVLWRQRETKKQLEARGRP